MNNKIDEKSLSEVTDVERRFGFCRVAIILRIHDLMKLNGLKMRDLNKWINANPDLTLKSILELEVKLGDSIIRIVSPKKRRQDDIEPRVLQ